MVLKATYLWEFDSLQLEDAALPDGTNVTWMQAFPTGQYQHPVYGTINSDQEFLTRMCANVKQGVRGQELDIDYDHKAVDGKAAGWVKDAQVRPDGLWIAVEWTPDAKAAIAKKEYRYFSPEFVQSWKHPKSGQEYKDVLFGGAITNRPFLKDIQPINMSELFSQQLEEGSVDPKALRKMLGLPEDATDEQVTSAVEKAAEAIANPPAPPETKIEDKPEEKPELEPELATLMEKSPVVKKLVESMQAMETQRSEDAKKLALLETSNRLSEVSLRLSEINTNSKRQLTPAQVDMAKKAIALSPVQLGDSFIKVLENIVDKGLVELGERGGTPNPEERLDLAKRYLTEVDKAKTEHKLSDADAATRVAREQPALWEAYNEQMMGAQ